MANAFLDSKLRLVWSLPIVVRSCFSSVSVMAVHPQPVPSNFNQFVRANQDYRGHRNETDKVPMNPGYLTYMVITFI